VTMFSVAPSAAQAACTSATPATTSIPDPVGDGVDPTNPFSSDLAPDAASVNLALAPNCTLSAADTFVNEDTGGLIEGDAVFFYLDTDANAGTGDAIFGGADEVVGTLGETGPDSPPLLGHWNGSSMDFTGAPVLAPAGVGGFAATPDQLGLPSGAVVGVISGSSWDPGDGNLYVDFAPDSLASVDAAHLPVNYSSVPLPAVGGGGGNLPKSRKNICRVPSLKGNTRSRAVRRLRHARCKVGSTHRRFSNSVKPGHVIKTSPGSGQGTNRSVNLYVSKGRRHSRGHRARLSTVGAAAQLNRLAALMDLKH
jgi:hypothetical protein